MLEGLRILLCCNTGYISASPPTSTTPGPQNSEDAQVSQKAGPYMLYGGQTPQLGKHSRHLSETHPVFCKGLPQLPDPPMIILIEPVVLLLIGDIFESNSKPQKVMASKEIFTCLRFFWLTIT